MHCFEQSRWKKCILATLFTVLFSTHAAAANQVVTSNADSGAGSLRQAIADVLDGESISFNLGVGNEVVTITSELATGAAKGITIDGDNAAGSGVNVTIKVFNPGISTFRVFNLNPQAGRTVTLKNMTIRGGNVSAGFGGAVLMGTSGSSLRMESCIVQDSKAQFGGGLSASNFTTVTIINSTFTTNSSASGGGAIQFVSGGDVSITGSIFHNNSVTAPPVWNYGGGIYFHNASVQGSLTIDKSAISNNTILSGGGSGQGGGLWTRNVTTTTITNSTVNNNNAGVQSDGGGVFHSGGALILTNSTIFSNTSAWSGGGVYSINGTAATITNATISKNSAGSGNAGGGYYQLNTPSTIKNTLLADNTANGSANDVSITGTVTDNGYNIVEVSNGYAWAATGDITGNQVLLGLSGTLALNSSVNGTQTLALSAGSIAVDAGDSAVNGSVTLPITDQRGLTRTATYDIGAYEYAATAPDVTAPTGTISIDAGNTLSNSTSVTLTLSCTDDTACTQMEFSNDNVSWGALTAYATSAPWTMAAGADGVRTVYARFSDAAANVSSVVSDTITLDVTPPAAPVISAPVNNTITTNTSRPTISGTAEAGVSVTIKDGATGLGMVTATGGNWSLASGGATLALGAHSFTATATDTAGNTGAASTVITYTVITPPDASAPSGTISIDAGNASTSSTSVTLTLTCTDNTACAQMQFSNDNTTWGALTAYATSASWSLTAGADGVRTVYARFIDAAANVSAVVSDTITLVTAPPADLTSPSGSISIDAGNAQTASTSVTLALTCSDNTGCAQMQFSNDNTTWGALTAYATSASWSLTAGADGVRTVYARFTDAGANVSPTVNDTITLHTSLPEEPAAPPAASGSGCSINPGSGFDPSLILMILLSMVYPLRRRLHIG